MVQHSPASAPPLSLTFDDRGLIPVIVQDHLTGEVRMFAYATSEAVRATLETGKATFWSRSRGELWEKGKTSGNEVEVRRVLVDCDADCLVYSGEPHGSTCHTGAPSCFFQSLDGRAAAPTSAEACASPSVDHAPAEPGTCRPQTLLGELEAVIESRKSSTAGKSYTKSLYDKGGAAIAAKLREEAGELAQAVEGESDDRVVSEAADVIYHLLVALRSRTVPLRSVLAELARRLGTSGHSEKASRNQGA